jgi:acetylglutamate kinase
MHETDATGLSLGRRVLVKVGGETLLRPEDRQRLAADLRGVWETGAELCVVHGGGPQITQLAEDLGLQSTFVAGRRVTDAGMLRAVGMSLCGEVGPLLLAACLAVGVPAVSTPAASAGGVIGRKRPARRVTGEPQPVDYGLVADIDKASGALVEALWDGGFVPLLSPLVCDRQGQLLNLNADSLVTALTEALHFDDVVLVTGVSGVYRDLRDPASHIPLLTQADLPELLTSGAVQGGMVAKLEEVSTILRRGARQVWIVGYKDEDAITAALTGYAGTRTVILREEP